MSSALLQRRCRRAQGFRSAGHFLDIVLPPFYQFGMLAIDFDFRGIPFADVAVRMADEGIPVRVIARCTKIPPDTLRYGLEEAAESGSILQIPRDDWPVNTPRDSRLPCFGQDSIDDELLILNVVRLFGVTQQQACLLLVLMKRREVTRKMLHVAIESRRPHPKVETELKLVDVVICKLRKKLKGFGMSIETVWSCGFFMPPEHRQKANKMLNIYMADVRAGSAKCDV